MVAAVLVPLGSWLATTRPISTGDSGRPVQILAPCYSSCRPAWAASAATVVTLICLCAFISMTTQGKTCRRGIAARRAATPPALSQRHPLEILEATDIEPCSLKADKDGRICQRPLGDHQHLRYLLCVPDDRSLERRNSAFVERVTRSTVPVRDNARPAKYDPNLQINRAAYRNRTDDLRITRVFACVARGFKVGASFMFAGCCWWRSLAVDGSSGASQGHAPAMRRPGSRWDGAIERPSASGCREYSYGGFGGGHPHFNPHAVFGNAS